MSTSGPAQWLNAGDDDAASTASSLRKDLDVLQLPSEVLPKLQKLGVHTLSEVIELDLHDLEGIGLSRLQVRRLQALASSRLEDDAPPPPPPGPPPPSPPRVRRRSRSPEWRSMEGPSVVRQRSASSKRAVRFRSVSAVQGLDFELDCRRAILTWMDGWAVELCPKVLGIHHDCDLLLRLSFKVPISGTMPPIFHIVSSSDQLQEKGHKDALLFFEMKSCAARVAKAIEQLEKRRDLAPTGSPTDVEIFLIAIVALSKKSDPQYYETLVKNAKQHPDIFIVWVDPDELGDPTKPQEDPWKTPRPLQRDLMFNDDYYHRKQAKERRFVFEGKYSGVIQWYKAYCGFGYLVPDDPLDTMPPGVREAIESNQWHGLYFRGIDLAEGVTLSKGTNVEFQVYTDKHSAGACNITILWQGW